MEQKHSSSSHYQLDASMGVKEKVSWICFMTKYTQTRNDKVF